MPTMTRKFPLFQLSSQMNHTRQQMLLWLDLTNAGLSNLLLSMLCPLSLPLFLSHNLSLLFGPPLNLLLGLPNSLGQLKRRRLYSQYSSRQLHKHQPPQYLSHRPRAVPCTSTGLRIRGPSSLTCRMLAQVMCLQRTKTSL